MKLSLLLGALALPLLLSGCGTYVGVDGYGPGYYAYGGPGYYDDVYGDVGVYGYDRGSYHAHYHHYDGGARTSVASHSFSHTGNVAAVSHSGGGHVGGGGGISHASASAGGGHAGGGHH
jgi:hypothetical protein